MTKFKYSIITPCYNSFNLMKRYFDSLEKQSFKNFEVLIVDDASTDNSYEKLLDYKNNTSLNLKVLRNKKNTGPGCARNYGIREASGEWLTFIDNDDFVDNNLLEKIEEVVNGNDLDCVVYDYCLDDGKKISNMSSIYNDKIGIVSQSDAIMYVRNHSVCKFYKTSILRNNNVYYPNIRRHEDISFVAFALSFCKRIYHLNINAYHYVQRKNSLSNNKCLDEGTLIEAFEILTSRVNKKFKTELKEKSVPDLLYGVCLIMCKSKKSRIDIINFINKYEIRYPDWYNCSIISFLGKGKKIFLFAVKYRLVFTMKFISKVHSILIG